MRRGLASWVALAPLVCGVAGCEARAEVSQQPQVVRPFLDAMASGDARRVADLVAYPLARRHPVPPVRDAADLVARFDELFPPELRAAVARRAAGDWQQVGWRGTMFGDGRLWIGEHGLLTAINDLSEQEASRRSALIAADRASLDEGLRGFEEPVLRWQTAGYRVRVDRMPDGALRYASWRRAAALGARPDLVLDDGDHLVEGTIRNESYRWRNGEHEYCCDITRGGADDTPPLELTVSRAGVVLLREPATPFYP